MAGQPNKMILNRRGTRLFVANDNSDSVAVVDTRSDKVLEQFNVAAPKSTVSWTRISQMALRLFCHTEVISPRIWALSLPIFSKCGTIQRSSTV